MNIKRLLTILLLILVGITLKNSSVTTMAKQTEEDPQIILYQDVILNALSPTINAAIDDYYKDILTSSPGYSSSFIKILDIKRPNGDRTWYFIISIEVMPYVGPHLAVGKDRITLELSYPGRTKILRFEHLEDYPLPEHYKDMYLH